MKKYQQKQGLALITVLIFGAVALIVIVFGITLMVIQTNTARQFSSGQKALILAESGMENALLRLLRDPNYSGEILTLGNGTATIEVVSNGSDRTVTVTADSSSVLDAKRTIQAIITEENGRIVINSWQEL
jgi:Tfp pilus assembly protein PilV